MPDITSAEAVRFSDEQIRPLAEKLRNLKAEVDAATVKWFGGTNALFPNDSSVLIDDRDKQGDTVLTGADVNNLVTQLLVYQTQLNQTGVADAVSKPCVRPLRTEFTG